MDANIRLNVYQSRLEKEQSIGEAEIQARMRWDMPILSENPKTSVALDLPVVNCCPTLACSAVCYASQGPISFRKSVIKALAVDRLIDYDAKHVAWKMMDEAAGRVIRLAGSGELLPKHKTLVNHLDALEGEWFGFTRRVDTHRVLPDLMFSIDATTPESVMRYVREEVPIDRRAYLLRPADPEPAIEVSVTFPVHGPWTNYVEQTSRLETDCPATREGVKCWSCKRCY